MRATLAAVLVLPLVVLFLVGSLVTGFSALLTPERTLAVVEGSNALPTLYRYGLDSFARTTSGEASSAPFGLDNAGFAKLIEAVVPEAQVADWLRSGIPAFYAWLDSSDPQLRVPLDLTGVKQRLGPAVEDVLAAQVSTVAGCTADEAAKLAAGEPVFCRVPGDSDAQVLQRVRDSGAVQRFVAMFPDTVVVPDFEAVGTALGTTEEPTDRSTIDPQLERIRSVYRQRGALAGSVWLTTGFLLLLQTLVHRSQHRRMLRWLGLTLVAMGTLPLLLGLAGTSATLDSSTAARLPPSLPAEVRAALGRLIAAAIADLLRIPLLFGALAVLSGVLGTVLSMLHPHTDHPKRHAAGS